MTIATPAPHGAQGVAQNFANMRAVFERDGGLNVAARRDALRALRASLVRDAQAYASAVSADFGVRSRHETLLTEVALLLQGIDYTLPRLERWARPKRAGLGWPFWPASARLVPQPRGVAAIIAPCNYPVQLALMPLIGALAAGCRVMVKPSELTPHTAALIKTSLETVLDPSIVSVICGDGAVAAAMTRLPFDVLLFTGSQRTGRAVLAAAASQLTPVVLELGGKSPVIIGRDVNLAKAAETVLAGKLLNAGQTCMAPDYVLVPRDDMEALIASFRVAALKLYPDTRDYTAVLSSAAFERLRRLEAAQDILPLFPINVAPPLYPPALVRAPALNSLIMQEEIFGPLLPLVPYDTLDDAIGVVRGLPPPLTLYWFGGETGLTHVLARTASGSIAVNETVIHAGIQALPFGGIGASGMGRYHGKAGFDTFTHERPVFYQSRWSITPMMRPPFGKMAERILAGLLK